MNHQQIDRTNPETWPYALTLKEVMTIIRVGKNKALELVQSGELPARKARGTWMISKNSLLKWLEE